MSLPDDAIRHVIDGHVHIYPQYRLDVLARAAVANVDLLTAGSAEPVALLLMTETRREHRFAGLANAAARGRTPSDLAAAGWTLSTSAAGAALTLEDADGRRVALLPGCQMVTREGLEVHALATTDRFPDGRPLTALIEQIHESGAAAAVPWGAGKWLAHRRRVLRRAVVEPGLPFILSDSALRPPGWTERGLFDLARRAGRVTIAGTDPLPLDGQERRVCRYGFSFEVPLDHGNLQGAVASRLRERSCRIRRLGRRTGWRAFLGDQWALRRRPRSGGE